MKTPSEWSVEELKRWLEFHGQKEIAKKCELVERVKGLFKVKLKSRSKGGRKTLVQCKIKFKQTE